MVAKDGGRRIARWLASVGAFVAVAAAGIGLMFLFPEPALSDHDFLALTISTFGLGLLLFGLVVAAPFVLLFIVALAAAWWMWTRFQPPAHRVTAVLRFATRADAEAASTALATAGFESSIERSADPARTLLAVSRAVDPTPAALRKLQQRLDDIAHAHAGEHDATLLRIEPNR